MQGNEKPLIYAPWPYFAEDEIKAAKDVLISGKVNYWTGEECHLFEKEFASYVGRKYAVALANGSLALELAIIAYDIGEGDEVVVASPNFTTSIKNIVVRGVVPVFADVDPETGNISPDSVKSLITEKTKAIVCFHLAGCPCDMDSLKEIAKSRNIYLIEDCSQAHGAKYKGVNVGKLGDISVFSFSQDKIMTSGGEGGMLLTDDEAIFKKCWSYKDHGKSYDKTHSNEHKVGFQYLCTSFGTNWRMTEMQAAIGRRQLLKLDEWVEIRRSYADKISKALSVLKAVHVPAIPEYAFHSYYKYCFYLKPDMLKEGCDRNNVLRAINDAGVYCGSEFCSKVHKKEELSVKPYSKKLSELSVTRNLSKNALILQIHPTLTEKDIDKTIEIVKRVINGFTKL